MEKLCDCWWAWGGGGGDITMEACQGNVQRRNLNRKTSSMNIINDQFYESQKIFSTVRHVTGNDQDYLGESPEWLFRYLRFSKRATVGVRATYATR
jgi:hypothetical protein